MCEQCVAQAVLLRSDVLPGYSLMLAAGGSPDWPKGWFGLVQINDPFMVFPSLVTDPMFEMTEAEIDALPGEPAGSREYEDAVDAFREQYNMPPSAGYELVSACILAGYNAELHGPNVECWLVHYLATQVPIL